MHLLHSLFSVPVGLYSLERRLFTCCGDLSREGLPPVVELDIDAFGVRRTVHAVLRVDHITHLEVVPPYDWQAAPCKRAGKLLKGGRDLACRGLAFLPPDGAALLLEGPINIAEASQTLFPLLAGRARPFKETLDWLQLAYTADRTGAYVVPESTVLAQSAVWKGETLFPALWNHLLRRYPVAYALVPATATLGPPADCSPIGRAPERRDRHVEEEEKFGALT